MSLILVHENTKPGPVNNFNPLIDSGSRHMTSASTYRQFALPDVMLDLVKLLVLTLQLLLVDPIALHLGQSALVLRYCRNVRPTWVKFDSKDTKESGSVVRGSEY